MPHRALRTFLWSFLSVVLVVLGPRSAILAAASNHGASLAQSRVEVASHSGSAVIPITDQPFYPELLAASNRWRNAPLSQVIGESPRETLLNFYAVMAQVGSELRLVEQMRNQEHGLFWSSNARQHISNAEELFGLAMQSLNTSIYPESIRTSLGVEATLQLKQVLDYLLSNSTLLIQIPNQHELKNLNQNRSKSIESWTLPFSTVTLSGQAIDTQAEPGFLFSGTTVRHVARMYRQVSHLPVAANTFATPGLYASFSHTPGYLCPPLWYLRLPVQLRAILEMVWADQSLFQIVTSIVLVIGYALVLALLLRRLLQTYHYTKNQFEQPRSGTRYWHQNHQSWYRVSLVFPILPFTYFGNLLVVDYINLTGIPMLVLTYSFSVFFFLSAGIFSFFLFEALGCTLSKRLVHWRGGGSEIQLRRVSNLIIPICRVLGGLTAVVLIYRLLLVLGLPSSTVLAFSAVPGLAIGLGASKLLGNLFGGLSIQTDRPVRVGEFCRIGENLGFVSKIGMRSLELQTLESRVTIPNAIVDDQTIINYSRRQDSTDAHPAQSLLLRVVVTRSFNPDQVADLLHFARLAVVAIDGVQDPLISVEEDAGEGLVLLCHAQVTVQSWGQYIAVRERILLRLEEVVEQIHLCQRQIGVSYDTSSDQLDRIPALIRDLVERDSMLQLRSCRLMTIAAFSYEYNFRFHSYHSTLSALKDAINRLNQDLLACFAAEAIEIPYPTVVEIRKSA